MKLKMLVLQTVLASFLMLIVPRADAIAGEEGASTQEKPADVAKVPTKSYETAEIHLYDLELLTQDGKRVRFKSDVIGDKLVAMTVFFTTCTTICPIYNAIFNHLQSLLGERLGSEVVMVSLSLNPTTDIPARMKREAQKYQAKPGWLFLTGDKQNVVQVLKGLDAYFPDFEQHPPMVLIGDGKTGAWRRFNGFPRPQDLLALIDELKAARGEGP